MKNKTFLKNSAKFIALAQGPTLLSSQFPAGPHLTGPHFLNPGGTPYTDIIPTYENVTIVVKLNRKDVKVHALCTGTVAVKTNFRKKNGMGELAKLNVLLDRHYTEYMPIWVWVIEHPEGLMVIDTGEISAVKNIGQYLAKESEFFRYFFKHSAKFSIDEKDELNYQFEKWC